VTTVRALPRVTSAIYQQPQRVSCRPVASKGFEQERVRLHVPRSAATAEESVSIVINHQNGNEKRAE
jgi:hypothetical protein